MSEIVVLGLVDQFESMCGFKYKLRSTYLSLCRMDRMQIYQREVFTTHDLDPHRKVPYVQQAMHESSKGASKACKSHVSLSRENAGRSMALVVRVNDVFQSFECVIHSPNFFIPFFIELIKILIGSVCTYGYAGRLV
jgi:hypothetical protein